VGKGEGGGDYHHPTMGLSEKKAWDFQGLKKNHRTGIVRDLQKENRMGRSGTRATEKLCNQQNATNGSEKRKGD